MAAVAEVPVELGNDSQTSQANTTDSEEKTRMEHARWIYANNILFLEPLLAR
jgi:hypothetical protein